MTYVFNMFLLLFIVVLILPGRDADTFTILNATHPDHVGKCYLPGPPPKIISVGHIKRDSKRCAELFCSKEFNIYGSGCAVVAGPGHCRTILGDPSKPYPQCCPEIIC